MSNKTDYRTITREQFLFNEMRIVATLLYEGKSTEEAINEIVSKNLFQYPTEKMIKNLAFFTGNSRIPSKKLKENSKKARSLKH